MSAPYFPDRVAPTRPLGYTVAMPQPNPSQSADALLAAVRAGDEAALDRLLALVQPQVYRFGMRVCGHPADAEDVLQETLLTLARRLREFRGDASLSTYIYTVARNHCIKKRRKRKSEPAALESLDVETADALQTSSVALPAATGDPHAALESKEGWTEVAKAIATLEPEQKEVLILRDIEGLSAAEVATVVGASVSAVKSRLHRARKALRMALGSPPPNAKCPDIVEMFSRKLEDQLDTNVCAQLEAHIKQCEPCAGTCAAIRRDLNLCRLAPGGEVPPEVLGRIRTRVRRERQSSGSPPPNPTKR